MSPKPRIGFLLISALACAAPSLAQRTTFHPSVSAGIGTTDNVLLVATGEMSDTVSRLNVNLPLERQWQRGSMQLSYRPSYVDYADVEGLDRDEHRLGFGVASQIGRRARFRLDASYSRTLRQASVEPGVVEAGVPDDDLFFDQTRERDSVGFGIEFERELRRRFRWQTGASWSSREHDTIDELAQQPGLTVEDRDAVGAFFGMVRQVSRGTSVGVRYERRQFDLDQDGDEDSDLLGVTVDHRIGRKLELRASLGGFRSSGEAADGAGADDERSGLQGRVDLTRNFRDSSIGIQASHEPTSGDHLSGTSTNTELGVAANGTVGGWGWGASARAAQRDPSESAAPTREAYVLRAFAERPIGDRVSVRWGADYTNQQSGTAAGDRSELSADVSVVWYPRGPAVRRNEGS